MRPVSILIFSLAASSLLFASACSWKEPPDLSPVREGNMKSQVIQYLGEPEQSWEFDEHTVTLHYLGIPAGDQADFNQESAYLTGYTLGLATPFILAEAAGHKDEHGIFLLSCFDDEDRFLSSVQRTGLESATQHVERFAEINCTEVGKLEERARSGEAGAQEACNLPVSEAMQLDAATLSEQALSCRGSGRLTQWNWECLAAHQGESDSQYRIAGYYKFGLVPIQSDVVAAYKWYSLASMNGSESASNYLGFVAQQMTPAEIAEAEHLVAEWKPAPAECEVEGTQAEN